eukprot:COSAG05_NODE_1561_length_4559_cov_17.478924_4_plen_210_part_00
MTWRTRISSSTRGWAVCPAYTRNSFEFDSNLNWTRLDRAAGAGAVRGAGVQGVVCGPDRRVTRARALQAVRRARQRSNTAVEARAGPMALLCCLRYEPRFSDCGRFGRNWPTTRSVRVRKERGRGPFFLAACAVSYIPLRCPIDIVGASRMDVGAGGGGGSHLGCEAPPVRTDPAAPWCTCAVSKQTNKIRNQIRDGLWKVWYMSVIPR